MVSTAEVKIRRHDKNEKKDTEQLLVLIATIKRR